MLKKKLILMFTLLILLTVCVPSAFAADIMQDSRFYAKQDRSRTCTLSAASMMLRRRAYLDGFTDWTDVTESDVRGTAWQNGLSHDFTYRGMSVGYAALSGDAETRKATLIELLAAHPEGIVAYDRGQPHAILLTDYTDDTFYCADPAGGTGYGRMPLSYASISLSSIDAYWYVSSDANTQLNTAEVDALTILGLFYPENIRAGASFNLGGILKCAAGTELTRIEVKLIDAQGNVVQSAADALEPGTTEWAFRSLNREITFGTLTPGSYAFSFVASDSTGRTLCFARAFTVSADASKTLYYWSNSENA